MAPNPPFVRHHCLVIRAVKGLITWFKDLESIFHFKWVGNLPPPPSPPTFPLPLNRGSDKAGTATFSQLDKLATQTNIPFPALKKSTWELKMIKE